MIYHQSQDLHVVGAPSIEDFQDWRKRRPQDETVVNGPITHVRTNAVWVVGNNNCYINEWLIACMYISIYFLNIISSLTKTPKPHGWNKNQVAYIATLRKAEEMKYLRRRRTNLGKNMHVIAETNHLKSAHQSRDILFFERPIKSFME